jgi:hypothetical protein
MTTAKILIPTAVSDEVTDTVKTRAADKFGGFTTHVADGGWLNPDGDLVEETVEVVEVTGGTQGFAEGSASFVANHSDETCVMWRMERGTYGFQS